MSEPKITETKAESRKRIQKAVIKENLKVVETLKKQWDPFKDKGIVNTN